MIDQDDIDFIEHVFRKLVLSKAITIAYINPQGIPIPELSRESREYLDNVFDNLEVKSTKSLDDFLASILPTERITSALKLSPKYAEMMDIFRMYHPNP